jgi:hypothetical protein
MFIIYLLKLLNYMCYSMMLLHHDKLQNDYERISGGGGGHS